MNKKYMLATVALFVVTTVLSLCVGYAIKRPATLGDESPFITMYYPVEDLVHPVARPSYA